MANRGEIALRVIRACHDLGMEAAAVFSDADRDAAHVRAADVAVRIGPAPATESYLRIDRIVGAARELEADAIHPGYGFLSERAAFAAAIEAAGVAFVGPGSETVARLGDKLAARRLAREAGVAVVPGTLEPAPVALDQVSDLIAAAEEIGFPLLVKAAAGGGGRGIRRVERAADLPAALAAGSAEAHAAFGDGAVYFEREIRPARHVEVQLLGDRQGTVVALGERDCSTQRRHQKLVEEAPAPGLTDVQRRALLDAATRLGRAARLENAATAEFLLDPDGAFWFLEVNTRLQVEHGVTELAAGVDIVREQLLVAAGRPLSAAVVAASSAASHPVRHAIEVRLSAEDPLDFAPAPGRVGRWEPPTSPHVRVDDGIRPGDQISADYDPLFAKLLAVALTRDAALDRLAAALDATVVTGIQSTLPFHRWLLRDEAFRRGELSIDFVAQRWDPIASDERWQALAQAAEIAAAVAAPVAREAGAPVPQWPELEAGPTPGWLATGRQEAVDRWPI
ncbi:MAG: acetyl-CoA carboxylase biotin carboxylase subunit [Chloroflexi bacterium]|nr:acetyl-CoA carboxylase biotin carboxylase subunit [Chloroflexota bacterium]